MLFIAVCLHIAMPALAEQAPVYDVDNVPDNMSPQADNEPPSPTQGQAEAVELLPPSPSPPSASASSPDVIPHQTMPSQPLSLEQRLRRIEQQMDNLQNNNSVTRVDTLQNEIQSLRGQVEQLTHQLQQLQSQQRTMYSDLDKRLSQQSTAVSKAKEMVAASATITAKTPKNNIAKTQPTTKTDSNAQPNVAEEQQIYQTAYNLIKQKKYGDAVNALQKMLQKYPSGQFASNAHYWLGELYGLMGKNDEALIEFDTVAKNYPESPRVSDAQLKIGLIYAAQLKWADAKSTFKKIINRYPGSASARLAAEQLKQIKRAGR